MEILYVDDRVLVCVKPAGVLSTDEPGGLPETLRAALGQPEAPLYTVHRLDQAVGGLMVLARTRRAAGDLGRAMMEGRFEKEYLAVVRVGPEAGRGTLRDFLLRDRARRLSFSVPEGTPGAKEALLDYAVLERRGGLCLLRVALRTGRTHQIRAQFAARGLPLLGDRRYGAPETDGCGVALWSHRLAFDHPRSGERMEFRLPPPQVFPWKEFETQWN